MAKEQGGSLTRQELTMRRKRGFIPRRIWNALVSTVFRERIVSVLGGTLKQTPEGKVLEVGGAGRPRAQGYPFQISVVPNENGNAWTINVAEGAVRKAELVPDGNSVAVLIGYRTVVTEESYEGLADNTSHGIWLRWSQSTAFVTTGIGGRDANSLQVTTAVAIDRNTTYLDDGDTSTYAGTLFREGLENIGTVEIADGVVTITQRVREVVALPIFTHSTP